jgi:hypothetical protein
MRYLVCTTMKILKRDYWPKIHWNSTFTVWMPSFFPPNKYLSYNRLFVLFKYQRSHMKISIVPKKQCDKLGVVQKRKWSEEQFSMGKSLLAAKTCCKIRISAVQSDRFTHKYMFIICFQHCNGNPIYVLLFWKLRGLSPNFHTHVSMSDLYVYSQDLSTHMSCSRIGRSIVIRGSI